MKMTAKLISLILSIIMILGAVFTAVINAGAANGPAFNVSSSLSGNTLTLTVNLTSGGFNSIDGAFVASGAAKCQTIKPGSSWIAFRDDLEENGRPAPVSSVNPETGLVSAATTVTYDKTGPFLVATFEVDKNKNFSVRTIMDEKSCIVTEGSTNIPVTPSVSNGTYVHNPSAAPEPDPDPNPNPNPNPETKKYTVKFNGNGATGGTMADQVFTYGTAQNLSANRFTRRYTVTYNYNGGFGGATSVAVISTFSGWATSANGRAVYRNGQSVNNLTESGTYNLYAAWTLGTVKLPNPLKAGYKFDGWYKDDSFKNPAGAADFAYTPTSNVTLYAKWTANPTNSDSSGTAVSSNPSIPTTSIVIVTDANGQSVTSAVSQKTIAVVVKTPDGKEVMGADGKPFTVMVPEGYKATAKMKDDGTVETDANSNPLYDIVKDDSTNTDEAIVDAENLENTSDDFDYDSFTVIKTSKDSEKKKSVSDSHLEPKIIIIIAAVAAVLIGGIVTAIVLIRKKNNGPQNPEPQNYWPQDDMTQDDATQYLEPQDFGPQDYEPQDYEPQDDVTQHLEPQDFGPQDYEPQDSGPQDD